MIGRLWAVAAGLAVGLVVLLAVVGATPVGDGRAPDGQRPAADPPVAWIESAQTPDWDALRAEAEHQRSVVADLGAGGATGPQQPIQPDHVPEAPPLMLPEAEHQRSVVADLGAGGATGPQQPIQPDHVPEAPPLMLPEADWPSYEWHDGDQTYEVWLDSSVAMVPDGNGFRFEDRAGGAGGAVGAASGGYPAFRSSSGGLMALPGGVILVLDPEWDATAVNQFLERNGIADVERTVFDFVPNGFVIATDPGFTALHLANDLAGRDGVEIASPNWLIEQVLG